MFKNLFIMMLVSFLSSCSSADNKFTMNVDNFKVLIGEGAQLVDVRTSGEFSEYNIPGAVNIDVQQSGFVEKADSLLIKDKKVAVYCRSGRRSKEAVKLLRQSGYDAYDLDGGILAWKESEEK